MKIIPELVTEGKLTLGGRVRGMCAIYENSSKGYLLFLCSGFVSLRGAILSENHVPWVFYHYGCNNKKVYYRIPELKRYPLACDKGYNLIGSYLNDV